jgi:hypothetical protein
VDVPEGEGVCFDAGAEDDANPVGGLARSLEQFEEGEGNVLEQSQRTIANERATCYRTVPSDGGNATTTCFNDAGWLLYVANEGEDASVIEATAIAGEVHESDFETPFPVTELPDE